MERYLTKIVEWIAVIHDYIMHLNDAFEYNLSDKTLHFIIIGALGLAMLAVVYPVFKLLNRKNHMLAISWIYVFTLELVITFAIEIGQKVTGTGNMEFGDVVAGMAGFFAVTGVIVILRFLWWVIRTMLGIGKHKK
ncbi:MAG: hypothetical protein Q4E13_08400 [Clostridia bacterium]|nr:hypothetical protein [Clostridia bacterium]